MAANLAPSRCTDTDKSWWPMHRKPKADDENQNEFAVEGHAAGARFLDQRGCKVAVTLRENQGGR